MVWMIFGVLLLFYLSAVSKKCQSPLVNPYSANIHQGLNLFSLLIRLRCNSIAGNNLRLLVFLLNLLASKSCPPYIFSLLDELYSCS